MKILLTGGCGFIGSNLAEELMNDNDVVIYDDFSLGSFENLQRINFKGKIEMGDILDSEKLKKVIEKYKIEQIYHLAAKSASNMFEKNLKQCYKTNVNGTFNVFRIAKELGVKKIVYASTSSVYCDNEVPFRENDRVVPGNFYSASKYTNEQLGFLFDKEYGLKNVGLRFFSVYGPNEDKKGKYANLLTQFIWGLKKGEKPIVYDDGNQTRDFIYVKDVCDALIKAMNSEVSGVVLNVGSGIQTNILDLVIELNKQLGTDIMPSFKENPLKGYLYKHQANTLKAETLIGFKIKTILSEGIKKTIEAYK
jgi:UDP-glucose 4-epimerase